MIGPRMAGPAIRALQMASTLSIEHDVVLASLVGADLEHPGTSHVSRHGRRPTGAGRLERDHHLPGPLPAPYPWLTGSTTRSWSSTSTTRSSSSTRARARHLTLPPSDPRTTMRDVAQRPDPRGDFFLCASEKQRDFWLGSSRRLGRVNPRVYDDDESLRSLIDVVPFGFPDDAPVRDRPGRPRRRRRHRGRRQRDHLGRRDLQLVRPASRSSGPSTISRDGSRTCDCSSWARRTRTRMCPRCGSPSKRSSWPIARSARQARVLQRRLGRLRRAAELPARRRRRSVDPLRARRDRVLLPHRGCSTTSGPACR